MDADLSQTPLHSHDLTADKHTLDILDTLRTRAVGTQCQGLDRKEIERFLKDPDLRSAIEQAGEARKVWEERHPELLRLPEGELVDTLQKRVVGFYDSNGRAPFVGLSAQGPWVVTTHGAVVYDIGGYGMLGLGHNPPALLAEREKPRFMANVQSASFEQYELVQKLTEKVGFTHEGGCPYRFIFMNTGSDANNVATRIADTNARQLTEPGAKHEGEKIVSISFEGSFHGRADGPARLSGSTAPKYEKHLASFRDHTDLWTVPPNDSEALVRAFERASSEGRFIGTVIIEPVMGEGNPGLALQRDFYDTARRLTLEHGSLLIVDSVQAGIRCRGSLSLIDYPNFADCQAPDMETFSKAINGGQYPFSVLALSDRAAEIYVRGTYGNTMTGNPTGCAVASAVLDSLTPELSANIRDRGNEMFLELVKLRGEFPGVIKEVRGTGLLLAADIATEYPVVGADGLEKRMRERGLNVIHAGENWLRFTPNCNITSEQIELVAGVLREVIGVASREKTGQH